MERRTVSETSARDRDLLRLRATQMSCCFFFLVQGQTIHLRNKEETDSENNNDDERGQKTGDEMSKSHQLLRRSTRRRRPPSSSHLCDREIWEECRREYDLPR